MADPISIIGLASAIVSLVGFGLKVIHQVDEIRNHDVLPEVHELNLIVADIEFFNATIRQKHTVEMLSQSERPILQMVEECSRRVTELKAILDTLKVREGAWSKTMESGRVALRAFRKKQDIQELRTRLSGLEKRLRDYLGRILVEQSNSLVLSKLTALREMQSQLEMNTNSKLEDLKRGILQLTETQKQAQVGERERSRLIEYLDGFKKEYSDRDRALKVAKSLYYHEFRSRLERIKPSEYSTNDWLFEPSKTDFLHWLEFGNGIFWITGLAGSGKSTLMKFASEHRRTREALGKWSGSRSVYCPCFYFWNQGTPMQKSQQGLLQSILYQIFKQIPDIILQVCPERLNYETWELHELKAVLQRVVELESLPARFCFFIDGLDEYDGLEEDLVGIIDFFVHTLHIKLCVSCRKRVYLDQQYQDCRETLVIHDFTKEDMRIYVRRKLESSQQFQIFQSTDVDACNGIFSKIADLAKGVWLWVFFITRKLTYAANLGEGIPKLQEIIDTFPRDLKSFFENIINGVDDMFKKEMAEIFLITIEEVEPLPLFAFSLLEKEKSVPNYATKASIEPISMEMVAITNTLWQSRLPVRCPDLLIIEEGQHPTFLQYPVDFLHRTVRDFLRDSYYTKLKELAHEFKPHVSLCNMMLFLLKRLHAVNFNQAASITTFIKIVDELLYYAHESEVYDEEDWRIIDILNEVEKVGCHHARGSITKHWTHIRDSPRARGYDEYREGGKCNFIALAVQARLFKYVEAILESEPKRLLKNGRPLLDYALRPRRVTPTPLMYHSQRDEASVDVKMVRLLLERGSRPNQPVHLNGGRTVWALFLLSCWESVQRDEASFALVDAWYQVSELMIQHGAGLDDSMPSTSVFKILKELFGELRAKKLERLVEEKQLLQSTQPWALFTPIQRFFFSQN